MLPHRWHLSAVLSLALTSSGCLTFHTQQSRLVASPGLAPARLTGDAHTIEDGLVSPVLVLTPSDVDGTQRDGWGDGSDADGPFRLRAPQLQLGLAGEVGLVDDSKMSRRMVLSGGVLGGRRAGEWTWATDGAIGARFHPVGLGLRFDVGVRTRNSHFDVSYTERYSDGDSSSSADGRISGTSVHVDPYIALGLNSRRPQGLNAFVTVEAGIYSLLGLRFTGQLVEEDHDVRRHATARFVTYRLFRRLTDSRRGLVGLRVGQIGGGGAVELLLRLDRIY
jgi:hypothetical protein